MEYNEIELQKKLMPIKMKYASKYSPRLWATIERSLLYFQKDELAPSELMQIYSEMGLELDFGDIYDAHLQKLKENFDIRKNILEIGGGHIPVFAKKIAHEQLRLKSGTITVYEPMLVESESMLPNLRLQRKEFTTSTRIKEFDIIAGIYPCSATEMAIESACQNNKDFYIALCNCDELGDGDVKKFHEYIIEKTESLLKKYDNGTLVVDRLGGNFTNPNPILYNKRNR